ncbi:MAG: endonuclease/exonuclease/phosphatase family protein [Acidimicrobiales bacterium]
MRVTGLDERRLRAIQAVSLGGASRIALLPSVILDALATFGLVEVAHRPPWWILLPILIALVMTTAPPFRRVPKACATGAELTLVSINLKRDSPSARIIADRLLTFDADLLLIQEYTAGTAAACAEAGLVDAYAHRVEDTRESFFGSALFSRFPLTAIEELTAGDRPMVRATATVGGVRVVVTNVHIQAPVHRRDIDPWRGAFADLSRLVAEGDAPAVLIVTGTRCSPTHRCDGCCTPRSTPTRPGPVALAQNVAHRPSTAPAAVPDHMLVTPDIEVVVREERVVGTDHKAVVAAYGRPRTPVWHGTPARPMTRERAIGARAAPARASSPRRRDRRARPREPGRHRSRTTAPRPPPPPPPRPT